jgi:hypothetical protein
LIWVDERELSMDDCVEVTFHARGSTSQPGRTIEELYPDESAKPSPPLEPPEVVIRELAQRPKAFARLAFRLVAPDGSIKEGCTNPDEHGFGLSVSWVSHRPGRARVSLHTYSLESLARKQFDNYHAHVELHDGERITFNVAA